jgi:UDP-glucose 4-epimerase
MRLGGSVDILRQPIPNRVIVTGGAGFIGANLCRSLVRAGIPEVVAFDDLSTGARGNLDGIGAELVVGTILDDHALQDVVRGARSIVHLAARPSVPRSIADPLASHLANATGTLMVLEAARQVAAHVIVASSSSVYGANPARIKSEALRTQPMSPYAVSKLAAESYTISHAICFGMPTLAYRFFNVYGPLQAPGHAYAAVIPAFIDAILNAKGVTVFGDGEQSRDFTYVGTVIEVLTQSVLSLIKVIEHEAGLKATVEHLEPRVGDVRQSQASDATIRSMFPHISPIPLEKGIEETVAWLRELNMSEVH